WGRWRRICAVGAGRWRGGEGGGGGGGLSARRPTGPRGNAKWTDGCGRSGGESDTGTCLHRGSSVAPSLRLGAPDPWSSRIRSTTPRRHVAGGLSSELVQRGVVASWRRATSIVRP